MTTSVKRHRANLIGLCFPFRSEVGWSTTAIPKFCEIEVARDIGRFKASSNLFANYLSRLNEFLVYCVFRTLGREDEIFMKRTVCHWASRPRPELQLCQLKNFTRSWYKKYAHFVACTHEDQIKKLLQKIFWSFGKTSYIGNVNQALEIKFKLVHFTVLKNAKVIFSTHC